MIELSIDKEKDHALIDAAFLIARNKVSGAPPLFRKKSNVRLNTYFSCFWSSPISTWQLYNCAMAKLIGHFYLSNGYEEKFWNILWKYLIRHILNRLSWQILILKKTIQDLVSTKTSISNFHCKFNFHHIHFLRQHDPWFLEWLHCWKIKLCMKLSNILNHVS